jgi:hypothetical protein
MPNGLKRVIRLVTHAGNDGGNIQRPTPRITEGMPPVEKGRCPDRGGDKPASKVGGGGACSSVDGAWDRYPRAIPDEVGLRGWEGECRGFRHYVLDIAYN